MAYLKDDPIDDPASAVWSDIARALGRTSSTKALEWASALPDEIMRREALSMVFTQMLQENPVEAAKQVVALPEGAARETSLFLVAAQWARVGMDEALAWANDLGGRDRETAMEWC
jgi:hypothetical protein